ncbi:MAG: hypothetical protein EHM39_04495, partial [Chloroflexi bacterium]
AVSADTMTVLSGVPAEELHANPERNPLTEEYPEGEELRTNPMRLTFDSDHGLELLGINLVIGGFYGFMLLVVIASVLGAASTWAALQFDLAHYRRVFAARTTNNPISHWFVLLLPLLFFVLLWLTETQQSGRAQHWWQQQEVQLLIGFGIILWGLVAIRAAQPNDWGLQYPVKVGILLVLIAALVALGIWRVVENKTYFVALSSDAEQSRNLSVGILVALGVLLAAQSESAVRRAGRFEPQFAATLSLLALLLMPLYLDQGQNQVIVKVGIYILLGLGLNIVVGYAGLLDLGYVAFFALGAYAYAFLSSRQLNTDTQIPIFEGNVEMVVQLAGWVVITVIVTLVVVSVGLRLWRQRSNIPLARNSRDVIAFPTLPTRNVTALITISAVVLSALVAAVLDNAGLYQEIFESASPFLIGIMVGVVVAGLSGIALGIPVLRLRGDYLAIVTLGFGEIIRLMFTNLRDFTGGPRGILQIPRPLPDGASGAVTYLWMVYLVFIGAGLVAFCSLRLNKSRMGRAWSAMRSEETIAQSMGINLIQTKLSAFAIGAAFAGVGGVLFAANQQNIYPSDFNLSVSIDVLSLVIIGGMGSIPGVIMGAVALIGVPEMLRELETYRILVFGALLVTMVIIRPSGLLPEPPIQLQARARALVHKHSPQPRQQEGQYDTAK